MLCLRLEVSELNRGYIRDDKVINKVDIKV